MLTALYLVYFEDGTLVKKIRKHELIIRQARSKNMSKNLAQICIVSE